MSGGGGGLVAGGGGGGAWGGGGPGLKWRHSSFDGSTRVRGGGEAMGASRLPLNRGGTVYDEPGIEP